LEELAWMNGELYPLSQALIPVNDRAVLYGDSVFETLRAYRGRPFRLSRHLERLAEGCRLMRIEMPLELKEIAQAVEQLIEANGLDGEGDAYIRITVTGGATAGPKGLDRPAEAGMFIIAHPYEPPTPEAYVRGMSLAVSGIKRNASSPLCGIKTGNCMDAIFAKQEASDRGFDDAVMLTAAGNIAEGTSWNIFMVKDDELLTPNMGCGFLPGITREAVVELALAAGVPVRQVLENHQTLLSCEEAFATGSTVEIMPIRQVGSHLMTFCPGPVTARLRKAYRELVLRETGSRAT
jgi:branched-chain amino acid aminotransferase